MGPGCSGTAGCRLPDAEELAELLVVVEELELPDVLVEPELLVDWDVDDLGEASC